MTESKAYEAPILVSWGTVEELTGVGNTNPGCDFKAGSVVPPGHGKGKGNKEPIC